MSTSITLDILGHTAYRYAEDLEGKAIVVFVGNQEHKSVTDISKAFCHLLLISNHGSIEGGASEQLDRDRWDLHLASKNCEMTTEAYFLFYECVKKYVPEGTEIYLAIHDSDAADVAFEWLRQLVSIHAFNKVPDVTIFPSSSFVLSPPPWLLAVSKINSNYLFQDKAFDPTLPIENEDRHDLLNAIKMSCRSYAHIYHPFVAEFDRLELSSNAKTEQTIGLDATPPDFEGVAGYRKKLNVIRAITKVIFPKISGLIESKFFHSDKKLFDAIEMDLFRQSMISERSRLYEKHRENESLEKNNQYANKRSEFMQKLVRFKEHHVHHGDQQEFTDFAAFLQLLLNYDGDKHDSSVVLPFFNLLDQSSTVVPRTS